MTHKGCQGGILPVDTSIRIQLMNTFAIYIDTQEANQLLAKSRKGVALMQYLAELVEPVLRPVAPG